MLFIFALIILSSLQVNGIPVFACNFENGDWCGMQNGAWFDSDLPLFNFTMITGQTAPDKGLSPTTDHTYNSSAGHFLYWHRPSKAVHTSMDGQLSTPIFALDEHMCLTFAYYIKSSANVTNDTYLTANIKGCYTTNLWRVNTDDTLGWQTAEIQFPQLTCNITIWFQVFPDIFNAVSVALDDITVDICPRYRTTTPTSTGYCTRFTRNTFFLVIVLILLNNDH